MNYDDDGVPVWEEVANYEDDDDDDEVMMMSKWEKCQIVVMMRMMMMLDCVREDSVILFHPGP